jgi:inositol phosphorylceramide mannosyltransferase catalytic subunit
MYVQKKMNTVKIPKIIMQTWKNNKLPEHWQASQDSIRKYMPDWHYVLMTDEMNRKFIKQHFPDFLPYYDNFPYNIQRADAIRYAWLYIMGGVYVDCDFEFLTNIDSLFYEDHDLYLVDSPHNNKVITNAFMAAKPGNLLWLTMIEDMKQGCTIARLEKHLHVMYSTGPMALTNVIKYSQASYHLLPAIHLNPYTVCDTQYDNPHAWTRPLGGSSWVGGATKFYHWIYCNGYSALLWTIVITVVLTVIVIVTYLTTVLAPSTSGKVGIEQSRSLDSQGNRGSTGST